MSILLIFFFTYLGVLFVVRSKGLHSVLDKLQRLLVIRLYLPRFSDHCDNRFLAWQSTSVKTWETLLLRGSTRSVTGNYCVVNCATTGYRYCQNFVVVIFSIAKQLMNLINYSF